MNATSSRIRPRRDYALKRSFDIAVALLLLLLTSPILLGCLFAVWWQDRHSPFYKAPRVARGGGDFTMIKIRSMVIHADNTGVSSTGSGDRRITAVGHFIRRYKIDELSQFLNVLSGSMSVVGPRPQVRAWGVDLYTDEEMAMLSVRPGITDLSSIVFSDEGTILAGAGHADLEYNRIIRPWKSRLCLFYIEHASLWLDIRICWLTFIAIVNKPRALGAVVGILARHGADPRLIEVCRRSGPLPAAPPPGATEIETGIRGAPGT